MIVGESGMPNPPSNTSGLCIADKMSREESFSLFGPVCCVCTCADMGLACILVGFHHGIYEYL